jgi:cysteine dioxygenase
MAVGLASHHSQPSIAARSEYTSHHFDDLVQSLKDVLGPSSGLDSKDVDLNSIMDLMDKYDAAEEGWVSFAMADRDLPYTRNLVDEGNGKSNLVSSIFPDNHRLVWSLDTYHPSCRWPLTLFLRGSWFSSGHPARAALSTTMATRIAS